MIVSPSSTILILMSDTGGGHRAAAEAIRDALCARFGDRYQVVLEDLFVQARWPAPLLPRIYPPWVNKMAWSWGAMFHSSNGHHRSRLFNRVFGASLAGPVRRLYERHNPGLVVSVHPLMNAVPERVLRRFNPHVPFVTVVTDLFSAHALWFHPPVDLLLVPTEGAARRARRYHVPPEKIHVVGQPISLQFAQNHHGATAPTELPARVETSAAVPAPAMRSIANTIAAHEPGPSKAALRRELGLAPDLPVALLVGGGDGMGRLYAIAHAVNESDLPMQLLVVAGRNAALRTRLENHQWQLPAQILGFATNMPKLMRAADFIVTKAGPGTIMEAVASGLPILLFGYLPGQERGNVDFVEQNGLGVLRRSPQAVVAELRRWLAPGSTALADMRARSRALARPDAALEAAGLLDALWHGRSPARGTSL